MFSNYLKVDLTSGSTNFYYAVPGRFVFFVQFSRCRDLLWGEHVNEMLYAGHSKVSLAIDNTFEEALAQLSAVEAMLTSCAPRSDSPKILGASDICRYLKLSETSMVTLARVIGIPWVGPWDTKEEVSDWLSRYQGYWSEEVSYRCDLHLTW